MLFLFKQSGLISGFINDETGSSFGVVLSKTSGSRLLVKSDKDASPQQIQYARQLLSKSNEVNLAEVNKIDESFQEKKRDRSFGSSCAFSEQLGMIGWEKVFKFRAGAAAQVRLFHSGRTVEYCLEINENFPEEKPTFSSDDLPASALSFVWTPGSTLLDLHSQLVQLCSELVEFWEEMARLDRQVWVLFPEQPGLAHVTRRLAITKSVSLEVRVDPRNPRSVPELKIVGPDSEAEPYRHRMNNNVEYWDESVGLVENLARAVETELPTPPQSQQSSGGCSCGVCGLSEDWTGSAPDQTCSSCRGSFHYSCLYRWLVRNAIKQFSFGLVGRCPVCKQSMKIKTRRQ